LKRRDLFEDLGVGGREKCIWLIVITRQAMYIQCNIEGRSCNHCSSGKAKPQVSSMQCTCAIL
jgi:hypothetical protein